MAKSRRPETRETKGETVFKAKRVWSFHYQDPKMRMNPSSVKSRGHQLTSVCKLDDDPYFWLPQWLPRQLNRSWSPQSPSIGEMSVHLSGAYTDLQNCGMSWSLKQLPVAKCQIRDKMPPHATPRRRNRAVSRPNIAYSIPSFRNTRAIMGLIVGVGHNTIVPQ